MCFGIYIALTAIFCGVFYIFGQMHLFGGADAWALIFIAFCIPTFPIIPLLNHPPSRGFLSFSVLINALILNLVAPVGIFIINIVKGNRAPLQYMFFGFPVKGEKIQEAWGFVMEDFAETNGKVERKFIGFWDSLRRMRSDEGRVYTKDLREHPEEFDKELGIYKKAGKVWISYAVPFILPITAGLITAIVLRRFPVLAIMKFVTVVHDMLSLKFHNGGLIPVIVQDKKTRDVLMMAYANEEAVHLTEDDRLCPLLQPEPEKTLEERRRERAFPKSYADSGGLR